MAVRLRAPRMLGKLLLLAGLVLVVLAPGIAVAGDYYPGTTPPSGCYGGSDANVCGTQVYGGTSSLPYTGGGDGWLTVLGVVVVAAGAGLVWVGRRSNATT